MKFDPLNNHRILVIDDSADAHADFRKILISSVLPDLLNKDEAALFGDTMIRPHFPVFEIDSAYQGQDGLNRIERSLKEDRPYALAFVDIRMPPGWDGIKTISKIWERYPDLQVVICTGFSDYSWKEIVMKLGYLDRMIVLKKPCENIEVLQLSLIHI